jgi:hypothetical protein
LTGEGMIIPELVGIDEISSDLSACLPDGCKQKRNNNHTGNAPEYHEEVFVSVFGCDW